MDANATVVLRPVGDVELWYLDADDYTWRLPLHVEWKMDDATSKVYGLVLPGTCFYHLQSLSVHAILGRHSLEERTDRWLLPRDTVEALLRKAPGIHAGFYYDWPDKTHPPIHSAHGISVAVRKPTAAQCDSFAAYVSSQHGLPADVVNVVLAAVAQSAPEWMLKHRKVIDLGFVRLLALPFRSNWKEIVMFKGKTTGLLEALLSHRRERMQRLLAMRLPATLCSPQNIALRGGSKNTFLDHTIEATTTSDFDKAVEAMEDERLERGDYVTQYAKTVERLYESIVQCLVHHAQKTQAAWAAVRKSSDGGGPTFVPSKPREYHGVSIEDIPVDIIPTGSDFSVFAEREGEGKRIPLPPSAHAMRQVSDFPQAADDLRTGGGNGKLVEPRPGGTNGMPVLDAGQGAGSRQPVFSVSSTERRSSPRMA